MGFVIVSMLKKNNPSTFLTRLRMTDDSAVSKEKMTMLVKSGVIIVKMGMVFVICPLCGKPDTKIIKEGGVGFIRCMACGSKNPVKGI